MSKRRGMAKAEKRQRLQAIFFDEKSPFTLKEMEKIGGKQGIVSQSIKEVLQELVDDNLVRISVKEIQPSISKVKSLLSIITKSFSNPCIFMNFIFSIKYIKKNYKSLYESIVFCYKRNNNCRQSTSFVH